MASPRGRDRTGPSSGRRLLAVQLGALLLIGAALGAVLPRATPLGGLAGGFLAWTAVTASALVRARWQRSRRRHPHWSRYGAEVVTHEVVRTGVGLVVVLFTVAPLTLGTAVLPTWFLTAVAAGVAAALPVGVAVELHVLNPDVGDADRRRLWRGAVAAIAVTALGLSLLVALTAAVPASRGLAWTAAALGALALTGWSRSGRMREEPG